MRNINLRYVNETYDADHVLTEFSVHAPEDFNFGYDIVDDIAEHDPERRAMVWCNPEGEEHVFTFADIKHWSDKTANYLKSMGVKRGDFVMVILRRHYQFWFTAVALAKIGAVMVPATFMLKEHDLIYRLQSAQISHIVCTEAGDIADVVDHVLDECPSVKTLMLVNPAGAGLTPLDEKGKPMIPEGEMVGPVLSGPAGVCVPSAHRPGWDDFNRGVREASDQWSACPPWPPSRCSCTSRPAPPAIPRWSSMIRCMP